MQNEPEMHDQLFTQVMRRVCHKDRPAGMPGGLGGALRKWYHVLLRPSRKETMPGVVASELNA